MKHYYNAESIIEEVEKKKVLSEKDIKYQKLMTEIPNHNHSKENEENEQYEESKVNNSKVVYRRKEYIIIKVGATFIVQNRKKQFKDGHTHTNNYNYAKSLIFLSSKNKLPNRPSKNIIKSLIRISKNEKYIKNLKRIGEDYKNGKLKK